MTDNNDRDGIDTTLNCLIVPIGNLFDLPSNQVAQAITINTGQRVSVLENAIRNRLNQLGLLGVQFSNLSLSIRQIHPGTVSERPMNSQAYISDFFNDQFQPRVDHFRSSSVVWKKFWVGCAPTELYSRIAWRPCVMSMS